MEVDETLFRRSEKGSRQLRRAPRKRGRRASLPGRSRKDWVTVLTARDRHKKTFEAIVPAASSEPIALALDQVIASDSVLCSDHWNAYRLLASKKNRLHKRLNAHAGIRVIDRVFHIQNVNAYHSRLKNWQRRFHGVATKYLDNYLGWHRFRDEHPSAFASHLLSA